MREGEGGEGVSWGQKVKGTLTSECVQEAVPCAGKERCGANPGGNEAQDGVLLEVPGEAQDDARERDAADGPEAQARQHLCVRVPCAVQPVVSQKLLRDPRLRAHLYKARECLGGPGDLCVCVCVCVCVCACE